MRRRISAGRECGIPAAVGIREARALFRDGELLEVDGYSGIVTAKALD